MGDGRWEVGEGRWHSVLRIYEGRDCRMRENTNCEKGRACIYGYDRSITGLGNSDLPQKLRYKLPFRKPRKSRILYSPPAAPPR